jgi:hypothetical protein
MIYRSLPYICVASLLASFLAILALSFLFLFGKLFDDYQMKSQKPLNKAVTVTFSIGI